MAPDFLATLALDRAQVVTACDAVFCALFRCESVVGKALDALLSPRDHKSALELSRKLARGKRVDTVIGLRLGDAEHLARVRIGQAADGFAMYVERVDDPADLVYQLVGTGERWKGMLRTSVDGIAILDEHGSIVEHNPLFYWRMAFQDAQNVTLREAGVVGRTLADLVGNRSPALVAYLRAPRGDLNTRIGELELVATPLALPSHARSGTFVLVRDVRDDTQIEARDAIIARDLANARAFQQMIFAKPPSIATHRVEVAYRPVAQVGGDVYDVVLLPDQRMRMFIADATGHGVTAALVTMLIKSAYDAVKLAPTPSEVLAQLNDRVAESSRSLDAMFTAAVVDVDLAAKRIAHASAAHLPPLLVGESGVTELPSGGTFMGVSMGRVYPSWTHELPDGASVYLLTDGLAEARRRDGEQFGDERVKRALAEAVAHASGAGDAVLAQLDAWLRPGIPDDDITILGLRPRYA